MTRREKNEAIGIILGFKKSEFPVNFPDGTSSYMRNHWTYPDDWEEERVEIPATLPDFIGILEKARKVKDLFKYGLDYELQA